MKETAMIEAGSNEITVELSADAVQLADPFPEIPALAAERLPPNFRKHVEPTSPVAMRAMAARGLVPLNPADLLHALAMLAFDADEGVAAAARKTAAGLPDRILTGALRDEGLSPRVMHHFAEILQGKDTYLEAIALNNATHDVTVAEIAWVTTSARILEIVAQNQLRLLREDRVLRAVLSNTGASRAVLDATADFAVRSGVAMYDLPAMVEAHVRIHGRRPGEPDPSQPEVEAPTAEAVLAEFGVAVSGEDAPPMEDGRKLNLTQQILKMAVAQKVKLAMMGNKEARTILLRDTNRVVCLAAINSPRITDGEIITMANSRTCSEDVLRSIMNNREWTKLYQVRLSLVKNPKVPLPTAMKLLSTLRDSEVKELAGNRNVPSTVRMMAKKLLEKKSAPSREK